MKRLFGLILSSLILAIFSSCSISLYTYEDADKYTSSSEFSLDYKITDVEINWINGDINISMGTENIVSVKEENYGNYPLFYYLDDTTLKIEFVESGTNNNVFNSLEKDLFITLPIAQNSLVDLEVNLINGNVNFGTSAFNDVTVDVVNGNVTIERIIAIDMDFKMVNGNAVINSLNSPSFDLEKVNGDLIINNIGGTTKIDINSVNGTDIIYVNEVQGYETNIKSLGSFSSDYDNLKSYGAKQVYIDYDAVNGSLIIKK